MKVDERIIAHYKRVIKELRKVSIPGFSCDRCGARWSVDSGRGEYHVAGCVLEGTEEKDK